MIEAMSDLEKILILGDLHVPFQDDRALDCMMQYAKQVYKPDTIVLNGDAMDFYSLSKFDKNPARIGNIQDEIDQVKDLFGNLRKSFPKSKIYYLKGNHSERLMSYLYKHSELLQLDVLKLENLLDLKKYKVDFIGATSDYWKNDSGHLVLGDYVVMHGDNRMNGARYSQYSGYAAKNTMMTFQNSTIQGHTHRLGMVFNSNPYKQMVGIECGCMCQISGAANWQNGFITLEIDNGIGINPRLYYINNGSMIVDGKKYTSKKKIQNPL
jgi:predicted phosphodiesterase